MCYKERERERERVRESVCVCVCVHKCNKTCEDILKNVYFYNFKIFCRIHKTKIIFSTPEEGTLAAYS